jgi:hypothetical protein
MAGPIYAVENRLADASELVAQAVATENAEHASGTDGSADGYPVGHLHSGRQSQPWRGDSGSEQWWNIDVRFSAGVSPDFVALHNHAEIAEVEVWSSETGAADSYTRHADDDDLRTHDTWLSWESAPSHEYWRIRFQTTGDGAPKIGELMLSVSQRIHQAFIWSPRRERRFANSIETTISGHRWGVHHNRLGDVFALSWTGQTLDGIESIEALFEAAKGRLLPFSFVPFPWSEDQSGEVRFGHLESDELSIVDGHEEDRSTSLVFVEQPREVSA